MQSPLRAGSALVAALALFTFSACSGEPFRYVAADASAAGAGDAAPEKAQPTAITPNMSSEISSPLPFERLVARRGLSEIVLVDAADGRVLASHGFEGAVIDLARGEAGKLFVAALSPSLDGCAVHALSLGADGFVEHAVSDPLLPETRLLPFLSGLWVLSQDMGTTWALYSSELVPVASKLLFRPSGAFTSGQAVVALNPSLLADSGDADELASVRFDGAWQLARTSFPAPGRPGSRLVANTRADEALVVHKLASESVFELGRVPLGTLSPPTFVPSAPVAGAEGTLESVVLEPRANVLVALLSRGGAPGVLALVPLDGAPGAVVPLKNQVESSLWPSRALASDGSGRVWVATAKGVAAFELAGDQAAPVEFAGSDLAAPFTGTW